MVGLQMDRVSVVSKVSLVNSGKAPSILVTASADPLHSRFWETVWPRLFPASAAAPRRGKRKRGNHRNAAQEMLCFHL
jgi:hypothetical protein